MWVKGVNRVLYCVLPVSVINAVNVCFICYKCLMPIVFLAIPVASLGVWTYNSIQKRYKGILMLYANMYLT